MSDVSWVFDIQTTVYSRVKALCTAKLKSTYPDINITMDDMNNVSAKYPCVYLDFLQPTEIGNDLDNQDVNGIRLTVDIYVTATSAQGMSVTEKVNKVVADTMKEMRFNGNFPNYVNKQGNYKTIARYSRVVASKEKLFTV